MREMLFRAKILDGSGWVYGAYSYNHSAKRGFIVNVGIDKKGPIAWTREVIPETVGQYTGLDDINGDEIFEGDIIRCPISYDVGCYPHIAEEIREVKYDGDSFSPLYKCCTLPEVIGNIHDNPELLKENNNA